MKLIISSQTSGYSVNVYIYNERDTTSTAVQFVSPLDVWYPKYLRCSVLASSRSMCVVCALFPRSPNPTCISYMSGFYMRYMTCHGDLHVSCRVAEVGWGLWGDDSDYDDNNNHWRKKKQQQQKTREKNSKKKSSKKPHPPCSCLLPFMYTCNCHVHSL